jgi:SAM-dependent methyltransferase
VAAVAWYPDIACSPGRAGAEGLGGTGSAFGVDLSGRMIVLARRLAERQGLANAQFEWADAQIRPFRAASFDVAISRTGTMFFGDPVSAFANIARALAPGGRLALPAWQGPQANE